MSTITQVKNVRPYFCQRVILPERSLFDRLDSDYRERFGLRIAELSTRDELLSVARSAASWYQQEEQRYQVIGIYVHLHVSLTFTWAAEPVRRST